MYSRQPVMMAQSRRNLPSIHTYLSWTFDTNQIGMPSARGFDTVSSVGQIVESGTCPDVSIRSTRLPEGLYVVTPLIGPLQYFTCHLPSPSSKPSHIDDATTAGYIPFRKSIPGVNESCLLWRCNTGVARLTNTSWASRI